MPKKLFSLLASLFILAACAGNYTVKVELTPEAKEALLLEVSDAQAKLEAAKAEAKEGDAPDHLELINLARAYGKLGQLGKAAKVYEDYLAEGHYAKAVIHNLGRLYEQMGRHEEAIAQYQRLIDTYGDQGYLYDIVKAHIKLKNRKEAEEFFNAWQLEFQTTDLQIQQQIQKLRDEEAA